MWQLKTPQSLSWAFFDHGNLKSRRNSSMGSKYKWQISDHAGKRFSSRYTRLLFDNWKCVLTRGSVEVWLTVSVFEHKHHVWLSRTGLRSWALKQTQCEGEGRGYWAGFVSPFFFYSFLFPPHSPHCRLHASPSSQRIYRGEKDLKGLEKKSSIVYWFYNRLSAREIKWGAGGAVWSTRGDGVTNTQLTSR